jgi:hypothetical protein
VLFSTGTKPATAIKITGGTGSVVTLIQADPPMGSTAPLLAPAADPGTTSSATHLHASLPLAGHFLGAASQNESFRTAWNGAAAQSTVTAEAPMATAEPTAASTYSAPQAATPSSNTLFGYLSRRDNNASFAGEVGNIISSIVESGLESGSFLYAPVADTSIETPFGTVRMASGSLVLVLSFAHGLAVYDLDDQHRGAVSVSAGGKEFKLFPGTNVVICPSGVNSFEQINPARLISYRNIVSHNLGENTQVFSSEFSVPSAIQAILPLKQLLSSNQSNARRISSHLLKTTAASIHVKAGSSVYKQYMPDPRMAMAR